jgi:hypothetical protein
MAKQTTEEKFISRLMNFIVDNKTNGVQFAKSVREYTGETCTAETINRTLLGKTRLGTKKMSQIELYMDAFEKTKSGA